VIDDLGQAVAAVARGILHLLADFGDRDQPDRGIVITSIGGS
jgi:hypothetical protein